MTDKQKQDWSNYWQGRAASESGAALVGAGIETDAEIGAFWDKALTDIPKSANILDLACGAGSVLRRAHQAEFANLTGADISEAAIATLQTEFPNVRAVVTPADKTPFDSGEFDLVASQFGFEYAGAQATAKEVARLVAKGGEFIAITHKSGGAIETEVQDQMKTAVAINTTEFVSTAKNLFEVEFKGADDAAFAAALQKFRPSQDALLAIARQEQGLAAHLYSGTQQLYQNRLKYNLGDILGWLDGMDTEVTAFIGRMENMINAALTESDVSEVNKVLSAEGLKTETPEVLTLGADSDEVAWIIRASRPA